MITHNSQRMEQSSVSPRRLWRGELPEQSNSSECKDGSMLRASAAPEFSRQIVSTLVRNRYMHLRHSLYPQSGSCRKQTSIVVLRFNSLSASIEFLGIRVINTGFLTSSSPTFLCEIVVASSDFTWKRILVSLRLLFTGVLSLFNPFPWPKSLLEQAPH